MNSATARWIGLRFFTGALLLVAPGIGTVSALTRQIETGDSEGAGRAVHLPGARRRRQPRIRYYDQGNGDPKYARADTPPSAVAIVPGGAGLPTDTDADGEHEDVNGNERKHFADVVLYFESMTWSAANEPVSAFDCNANGRVDFADIVRLFNDR